MAESVSSGHSGPGRVSIVGRAALRYVKAEGGSNTEGEATRSLDRDPAHLSWFEGQAALPVLRS